MGPGSSPNGLRYNRRSEVIKYVNKRLATFDQQQWENDLRTFASLDLTRQFKVSDMRLPMPPEEEIEKVLVEMGKANIVDRLGCGACGYRSCRDFAVAHIQGLTNYEMCYTYTNKKLQAYVVKVNAANEKLPLLARHYKRARRKPVRRSRLPVRLPKSSLPCSIRSEWGW